MAVPTGVSRPPPTPWVTRAMSSSVTEFAKPAHNDAAV
jgi:hypothetical protein